MIKIKYITLLFPLFLGCQNKETQNSQTKNHNNVDKNMIEIVLKKQLENGASQFIVEAGVEIPKEEFSDEELDASTYFGKRILDSNGYKNISNKDFYNKVVTIFKRKLDSTSQNRYVYVNLNNICNKNFIKYPNWEYSGFYIIKQSNFISQFYFIPEIVNYQKEYPKIAEIENTISLSKELDDEKVSIERWRDLKDLSQQRRFNQQLLISRNKYLFNDDKSQFAWLITNDAEFMESLVTTFGYTEDKKLLKWVMEKNYERAWEFVQNNIFIKNCSGNLEIREGILNYIWENTNNEERKYAMQLLYLSDRDNWKDFSDSEYTKILAYMANTFDPLTEKYEQVGLQSSAKWSILGGLHFSLPEKEWDKLIKEFKKNNYYNLPHLQEAIKIAETY